MYSYMKVRRLSAGNELFDALSVVSMNTSDIKLCIFYSLVRPPEVAALRETGDGSEELVFTG